VTIAYQFAKLNGSEGFSAGNFFSFFTIQSNIAAAATLLLTALVRQDERSKTFDAVRGAATFYIAITGAVFALLLSGHQEDLDTDVALVNFVVHFLTPLVLVVDWFLDPPRHRIGTRIAVLWLTYPVAWFAYTLIRGSVTGWYPYPFVDVNRHGYATVLLLAVMFTVVFAAFAALFSWLTRLRAVRMHLPNADAS
jgi:hypothetical protein